MIRGLSYISRIVDSVMSHGLRLTIDDGLSTHAGMRLLVYCLAGSLSLTAVTAGAAGRQIKVDPIAGDSSADGVTKPVKTIARGIKLAGPGDTVSLAPGLYRESIVLVEKHGAVDQPITIDGRGATIEGSDPIVPEQWQEVEPGLFRHDNLLPRFDDAMLMRWFFLWNGRMNHMGRTSKGPKAALKAPQDLVPGEWTFVKDEARAKPGSQAIFGSFYLRLPAGQKLADARIAIPTRSAGVQFSGNNSHLVVRNVTATHVYNDGFNIHGSCREVVFENIVAIECGDDGISAHDGAQYRVSGFTSIGNSTGICDVGNSVTSYERVFLRDNRGADLLFMDNGRYRLRDAVINSTAASAFGLFSKPGPCTLEMENVLLRRTVPGGEVRISDQSALTARRVTSQDLSWWLAAQASAKVGDSLIAGPRPVKIIVAPGGQWQGAGNDFQLAEWQWQGRAFTATNFSEFQRDAQQEIDSRWRSEDAGAPATTGADVTRLKELGLPVTETLADGQPTVVCFGDSITHMGYPKLLAEKVPVKAINSGIGGSTTRHSLRRLQKDVLAHRPDVVALFFGANDSRQDAPQSQVSLAEYENNLREIVRLCQRTGAKVVLGTMPPINPEPYFTRHPREKYDELGGLEKIIADYRAAAIRVADATQATLVDLNTLLAKDPGWMSKDGVHPTPQGSELIASLFAQEVAVFLKPAPAKP